MQPNKKPAIEACQLWPRRRLPPQYRVLMAEPHDFCLKRLTRPEEIADGEQDVGDQEKHDEAGRAMLGGWSRAGSL